jgi:hypothetical protein
MFSRRRLAFFIVTVWLVPTSALAQVQQPFPVFAADVRATFPKFKEDATIATSLGVEATNLPTWGLGFAGGAHVYPFSLGRVKVGFGGEVLVAGASETAPPATADGEDGPTVETRMTSIAPQVSLNFGRGEGWSYVSGGLGWVRFTAERADAPVADGDQVQAINYGGGARWFAKRHLAFTFDLRFYSINAQEAGAGRPAYPKMRLMVLSAGMSLK